MTYLLLLSLFCFVGSSSRGFVVWCCLSKWFNPRRFFLRSHHSHFFSNGTPPRFPWAIKRSSVSYIQGRYVTLMRGSLSYLLLPCPRYRHRLLPQACPRHVYLLPLHCLVSPARELLPCIGASCDRSSSIWIGLFQSLAEHRRGKPCLYVSVGGPC